MSNFRLNNGEFPSSLELLTTRDENGVRYLDTDGPLLDPWGNPYVYTLPAEGESQAKIQSLGADGKPGGTGADADITLEDIKNGK